MNGFLRPGGDHPSKRRFACVAAALLLLTAQPVASDDTTTNLSGFVEQGMSLWNVPGMAVSVVSHDSARFQQGFGETAAENGSEVDEHTLFAIASTTKAMVVAGILMLADEGKLTLDDPVVQHIPELRFNDPLLTRQMMIRDLLAHRTGLPSTDFWSFFQDMPLDEQVRRLEAVPAEAPLRTRLIYQNTMYELAGVLIQRLSGMRWDRFLEARLWRPLGMNDTFGARGQIPKTKSYAKPYFYSDGRLSQAEWDIPLDLAEAAGSAWSSLHDMSLWAQFLLRGGATTGGERLISEAAFEEMFEPQQLASPKDFYPTVQLTRPHWRSYGLAWFQQDFQGRKIDFHTGSLSGLIALIGLDRDGDRAVVVLGNRDHAEMRHALLWEVMDNSPPAARRDWNREVFDLYASLAEMNDEKWAEAARERLTGTTTSLPLNRYGGTYESAVLGQVSIVTSNETLILRTDRVDIPMSHWHLDTFLVEYEPWAMREYAEFRIGPEGTVSGFRAFGSTFTTARPRD